MKEVPKGQYSELTPDQFGDYYAIYGIARLKKQSYIMLVIERDLEALIGEHKIFKAKEISLVGLGPSYRPDKEDEKQLLMLANFLSRDHLHFCTDGYNLTLPLEKNLDGKNQTQKRFLYNENCLNEFGNFKHWGHNIVSAFIGTEATTVKGKK